jgi:membrane protein
MAIASQAFTALIPLLILVTALAPSAEDDRVARGIINRFDLGGDAAVAVERLFAQPENSTVGGLSVVLLLFSGISLTRRLQRMYLMAWRLETVSGVRGSLNATLGLGVLLLEITLLSFVRTLLRGLPSDGVLAFVASTLAGVLLWTSIPWLLLDRRIRWRRLLVAGVLASTGVGIYGAATSLYMPRLMETYSERYGLFGVTLALVGWLLAVMIIVVTATVVAAELDRTDDAWARRIRTRLALEAPSPPGIPRQG